MKTKIKKYIFAVGGLAILLVSTLSMAANFYVETDGDDSNSGSASDPFATITGAMENSEVGSGDTIYVGSGTFEENIIVDKEVEIYGDGTGDTIISPEDDEEHTITISADDTEIKYLTVTGSTSSDAACIYVESGVQDGSIRYCEITDGYYGVYLDNTDNVDLYQNDFQDNVIGLYLNGAEDSDVTYNSFDNNDTGIYTHESDLDGIDNNDFSDGEYGIYLDAGDDLSDDDVESLEEANDFDDLESADVYLDEDSSCFISTGFSAHVKLHKR